jgi:hypothetical protein
MRLSNLSKNFVKLFIFFLFIPFPLLGAEYSETDRKSLDLYFDLDNGELRLQEVALISSPAPQSVYLKGGYKTEIRSQDNKILYQSYFRDPGIVFYDLLDTATLALSGGIIHKSQSLFKIRIPYLPEVKSVSIFDPAGNTKYRADMSQLVSKMIKVSTYQRWEVDTVRYNGDPANRIDIVFLGDGYAINDTARYSRDVQNFLNYMFNVISPYDEYSAYFNVYKVKVISQQSGSDHPPRDYRNTALGTYYGCDGIDRLICADDDSVYAAAQSVPWYDQIAVLVNDDVYGGSGGSYLIAYNGYWGAGVFMHELGHSFANLADEYLYGNYPGYVSSCNCDENSFNPKWQEWISTGSPGVGAFLGCSYNNLYRPTSGECMMWSLQNWYCVVCREQSIKSIYGVVRGYDYSTPLSDALSIDTLSSETFDLTTLIPNNHSLLVNWFVNGRTEYSGSPFNFVSNSAGFFGIRGSVYDTTSMVLDDPLNLLVDSKEWQVWVGPHFLCGDPNQDSSVSVSDIVFLINYLFKNGSEPVPLASADVNLDREVTITDLVYLIRYLFKGGLEPCHF